MSDLTVKDVQRITEEIRRFERVVRIWRECWEETSPARCTHAVAALEAARRFLPIVQELAGAAPAVAPGAEAVMDPRLEEVIRAAIELTTVAFVNQKLSTGTKLHEPMQRLMNALSDYPPHWDVLASMNDEDDKRLDAAPAVAPGASTEALRRLLTIEKAAVKLTEGMDDWPSFDDYNMARVDVGELRDLIRAVAPGTSDVGEGEGDGER